MLKQSNLEKNKNETKCVNFCDACCGLHMKINPPKNFIIICDKDGDAVDVLSHRFLIDGVYALIRLRDRTSSEDGPHTAWEWDGSNFIRLTDVIHQEVSHGSI